MEDFHYCVGQPHTRLAHRHPCPIYPIHRRINNLTALPPWSGISLPPYRSGAIRHHCRHPRAQPSPTDCCKRSRRRHTVFGCFRDVFTTRCVLSPRSREKAESVVSLGTHHYPLLPSPPGDRCAPGTVVGSELATLSRSWAFAVSIP